MPISQAQISEHTRLVNSLNTLDYVPVAQEDNSARLDVVRQQLRDKEQALKDLRKKTKSEYKDTQKMNSSFRRLIVRICDGGSAAVQQRIEKEQTEYKEAFAQQQVAQHELEVLVAEKNEREAMSRDLAKKVITIKECQKKIEELYQGLFDGPTPEFPEEEEAERRFNQVQVDYNTSMVKCNSEVNAHKKLDDARKALRMCISKLQDIRRSVADPARTEWTAIVDSFGLTSAMLDASMAKRFFQEAQQCVGWGVIESIGNLDVYKQEYTTEVQNGTYEQVPVPGLGEKLTKNVEDLEKSHVRLLAEMEHCVERVIDHRSRITHYHKSMKTLRSELAEVRCEIMLRVTDPATIQPSTHTSAPNAIEVGDSELPTYTAPSPTQNSSSSPLNHTAATSIAVPTYEEAQTQAQAQSQTNSSGGFRISFGGANGPEPRVPDHAPPGIGPAPGPGGIGGFRVAGVSTANEPVSRGVLSLSIPEPRVSGSSVAHPSSPLLSPPSPNLAPPSPQTPGASPTSGRPSSWYLNPYAGAMIRQQSTDQEEAAPPGAWRTHVNPFFMPGEPYEGST